MVRRVGTRWCRAAAIVIVGMTALSNCGCAFIPTPVRLLSKPHATEKQQKKNVKVCLIVRDERPRSIQDSNMCGMMRNLYMIPTSFAFLSHREHLDQILAHHLSRNFEHMGYDVVTCYPLPLSELSTEKVKTGDFDKDARHDAWWKESGRQNDPESKRKDLKGGAEALEEGEVSPWGEEIDVSLADVVVEVKIRKFWSDMGWAIDVTGVFAWMSANMAVCDAHDASRRVVFGRKVKGFGHGRGFTPLEAYGIPINMAYWFVMHEMEKVIGSDEFCHAVEEAKTGRLAARAS